MWLGQQTALQHPFWSPPLELWISELSQQKSPGIVVPAMSTTTIVPLCKVLLVDNSKKQKQFYSRSLVGDRLKTCDQISARKTQCHQNLQKRNRGFCVFAVTEGSAEPSKSEENLPSWAKPDADEPPPWARDEGKDVASQQFEVPYIVYLLASAVTAIAAIGSVFEYVNQRPVFGVVNSDSIFYAPLLGFFAFTGIPTSAFLWYKAVQVANKEAEEQDRRDGYM